MTGHGRLQLGVPRGWSWTTHLIVLKRAKISGLFPSFVLSKKISSGDETMGFLLEAQGLPEATN